MEDSAKICRASLNGGAAPQSGESGDPIVDWTASGTARWMIDASGCLVIAPLEGGQSGELGKWDDYHTPWYDYCSSITSAKIEGQIAVSTARSMFLNCRSLESLDLSGLDTSSATDMSYMFSGCSSLKSLDLSGFDTSSVVGMRGMFDGCSSLESLDLSGFDTSSVLYIRDMFDGCSGLRTVTLGEKFSFADIYADERCYLPTPQGKNLTGKWLSSADGKARACEAVSGHVAATYTAQVRIDISDAVISGIPAKMTATGEQLTPEPVVEFNGERLVEGVGYTVSYGTNVDPGAGAGSVTVSAAEGGNFAGSVTVYFDIETKITFPDVDYANDWFAPAVTSAAERGLITGYADTGNFGPLDTLTRGQLATILWRDACPDEAAAYDESKAVNETGLDGISDHEYYTAAANWAVREGVVTGFERADGTFDFAADDAVSFEQMVAILSRLCAASVEVAAAGDDLSRFVDGGEASPWSRSHIAWAAQEGLVNGYDNEDGTRTLAPGEDVGRGRAATVLMRAFELGIME